MMTLFGSLQLKKKTPKKEQTSQIKVGHYKIIKAFSSFRLERFFFFLKKTQFIVNPFINGFGASPCLINITHEGSVTDRDGLENWSHGM